MNNTLSNTLDFGAVGLNWIVYAVNENQLLQNTLFILSMISTIIVFLKTIIPLIARFVRWAKVSFKDGKIDQSEQDELAKILDETQKAVDEAKEKMTNGKD